MSAKSLLSAMISGVVSPVFRILGIAYLPFNQEFNGLGNRVKGIANFYASGYRRFLIPWTVRGWVTDSWHSLFRLEDAFVYEINNLEQERGFNLLISVLRRFLPRGIIDEAHPFWSFKVPQKYWRPEYKHRWSFCDREMYSIDFRFNEIDEDVKSVFGPFFKSLLPSGKVQSRIDSFPGVYSQLVSVQVRNTGIKDDRKGVCSLESIMAAMDSHHADQRFFLSVMNDGIRDFFVSRYGRRVCFLPDKDCTSMVDAVADMWILGHCREMIASPRSTFSEVAWWWGGAQIPVTHLETEYDQCVA
jgi:hypothetical protein